MRVPPPPDCIGRDLRGAPIRLDYIRVRKNTCRLAAKSDLTAIAEKIISNNSKMRFVAIIDLKGNIVEGIMKKGKTSLESQKEEEHFCRQVGERRKMRKEFDKTLGKVRYVHVERDMVSQLVVYTKKYTIFITVEPELGLKRKVDLVTSVKKLASNV